MSTDGSSSGDSTSNDDCPITDDMIRDLATSPKAVTTDEGRVEERAIDDMLKARDYFDKRKKVKNSGVRRQVHRGPGTP